jgi:hypothetical protein
MRCIDRNELLDPLRSRWTGLDAEVVEIPLLLPGWQVVALERAAQDHGLTTAEMVRRLIRDFCCSDDLPRDRRPISEDESNHF